MRKIENTQLFGIYRNLGQTRRYNVKQFDGETRISVIDSTEQTITRSDDSVDYTELWNAIQSKFPQEQFPYLDMPIPFKDYMTITVKRVPNGWTRVHYEWLFGRNPLHVALHFEGNSIQYNQRLLSAVNQEKNYISQGVPEGLFCGDFGSRGWTSAYYTIPQGLMLNGIEIFSKYAVDMMCLLIECTWPFIEPILIVE